MLQTTPFQLPVNPKHVPDYERIVKNPISLQNIREVRQLLLSSTVATSAQIQQSNGCLVSTRAYHVTCLCVWQRVKAKRYETRESFIRDVSVLVQNSEQYNGPNSVLTDTAKKMLDLCLQTIAEASGPPELANSKLKLSV